MIIMIHEKIIKHNNLIRRLYRRFTRLASGGKKEVSWGRRRQQCITIVNGCLSCAHASAHCAHRPSFTGDVLSFNKALSRGLFCGNITNIMRKLTCPRSSSYQRDLNIGHRAIKANKIIFQSCSSLSRVRTG